jgi:hypothetical protein
MPKIPTLVNFGKPGKGTFKVIWDILWQFATYVHSVLAWSISSQFGLLRDEKSGNPWCPCFMLTDNHQQSQKPKKSFVILANPKNVVFFGRRHWKHLFTGKEIVLGRIHKKSIYWFPPNSRLSLKNK